MPNSRVLKSSKSNRYPQYVDDDGKAIEIHQLLRLNMLQEKEIVKIRELNSKLVEENKQLEKSYNETYAKNFEMKGSIGDISDNVTTIGSYIDIIQTEIERAVRDGLFVKRKSDAFLEGLRGRMQNVQDIVEETAKTGRNYNRL